MAIQHADGHVTDVLYNASVYEDEYGNVKGVFTTALDVTQRTKAEEKMRKTSVYARTLIETQLDPLIIVSLDGLITVD